MATSRRVRGGDLLINMVPGLSVGLWSIFRGDHDLKNYVLMADFGLEQHVWEQVSERIFGVRKRNPGALAAAITNGTAPGLYVREGDDTSDWETYRQVLARRVEEAMAARRGVGAGGAGVGETTTAERVTATRQDDEIRVGNPVPPTAGVYIGPATIRFDDRAFTGTITATGHLRRGELPVSSLPTAASPPSPPSRFSLLEVDGDTDVSPAPAPQALKVPVDLAALQQELRAEREARRALAAAQTPPGRFDLLECDLPAVPVAAVMPTKARPQRPAASSPPPRRPVETITDLTTARSPHELARMLEGLNDELSTMMRQREAN